tara:strand:- start:56 stop:298 length:243 start_codon:yes stop_codon:yes gene_type:complete
VEVPEMDTMTLANLLNDLRDLQSDKDRVESELTDKAEEISQAQYDLENMFNELEDAISTLESLDVDAMMNAVDEAQRLVD